MNSAVSILNMKLLGITLTLVVVVFVFLLLLIFSVAEAFLWLLFISFDPGG